MRKRRHSRTESETRLTNLRVAVTSKTGVLLIVPLLSGCASLAPRIVSPEHKALETAYREAAPDLLDGFFREWEERIRPLTGEERATLPEAQQAVYAIFEAFYTPSDLARIGDSEIGDDIYGKVPYFAVQNAVDYSVVDRIRGPTFEKRTFEEGTIADFRPVVGAGDKRTVFLSESYERALWAFLGDELTPMGESSVMSPALPKGESQRRADFVGRKIKVWAGHWGGWHIATHPRVENIEVNDALTEARLDFKLVYEWGEAFFQRRENGWEMTSSRLTMIE